jgi:hypothetical protein
MTALPAAAPDAHLADRANFAGWRHFAPGLTHVKLFYNDLSGISLP